MRVLVVEDEPLERRELMRLLAAYPTVQVVRQADSPETAIAAIVDDPPDVVFLDIRLGHETGFQIVPEIPPATAIVFVTAYDEYAVRAFEVHALDYLLKPVEPDRLRCTIDRLMGAFADDGGRQGLRRHADVLSVPSPPLTARDWLFLRMGRQDEFVQISSICCVLAEGDYSRIMTVNGKSCLLHRSLNEWEQKLPGDSFVRVHRSALVNLHHVVRVERAANFTGQLQVSGARRRSS